MQKILLGLVGVLLSWQANAWVEDGRIKPGLTLDARLSNLRWSDRMDTTSAAGRSGILEWKVNPAWVGRITMSTVLSEDWAVELRGAHKLSDGKNVLHEYEYAVPPDLSAYRRYVRTLDQHYTAGADIIFNVMREQWTPRTQFFGLVSYQLNAVLGYDYLGTRLVGNGGRLINPLVASTTAANTGLGVYRTVAHIPHLGLRWTADFYPLRVDVGLEGGKWGSQDVRYFTRYNGVDVYGRFRRSNHYRITADIFHQFYPAWWVGMGYEMRRVPSTIGIAKTFQNRVLVDLAQGALAPHYQHMQQGVSLILKGTF